MADNKRDPESLIKQQDILLLESVLIYLKALPIQARATRKMLGEGQGLLCRLSETSIIQVNDFNRELSPLIVDSQQCYHFDQAVKEKKSNRLFVLALMALLESKI